VASVGFVISGLVLSGCAGAASNDAGSGDGASAETITIKIATVQPSDSVDVTTLKEIAKAVAEKSDGSIELEIYDNGQIGTTADTAAQAASGEDIITFIDAGTAASLGNPDMSILGGPFLFEDADQAAKFAKSEVFAGMARDLAENGNLQILAMNWLDGPRHIWGNSAYPEPTDLQGLKLRTPPIESWDRTFKPLGAVTTTIENTEAYSALEQGVVEAAEGPINGTYAQKWYEVAPELTLTGHFRTFLGFAIGAKTFDKLSAEQQQILMDEFVAGGDRATERYVEVEGVNLATMEAAGVTVHKANIAAYQDATADFYTDYGDLLEKVRAAGK
jgi:TRAP-type C4-dicarboxylate transport system substrate-binding protein